MDSIIREQFISSAEEQIEDRLSAIQTVRERFTSSFEGYQSIASQKTIMIVLFVVAAALALAAPFLAQWLTDYSGMSDEGSVKLLVILALYSMVLYLASYAVRVNIRVLQWGNLKKHVDRLDGMTAYLKQNKEQLGAIYDSIVSGNDTEIITADQDVEGELSKLDAVSHEYHDENRTAVDALVDIMYWVSSVLICAAFVVVTGNRFCTLIESIADFSMHTGMLWIFGIVTAGLFLVWNYYNGALRGQKKDIKNYLISDASGLVAMPVMGLGAALIMITIYVIAFIVVVAIIVGIFAAIFNS